MKSVLRGSEHSPEGTSVGKEPGRQCGRGGGPCCVHAILHYGGREGLKSLRGWLLHAGSEREANSFSRSSSSLMHHPSAYLLVRRFKYFSNFYIDLDARHIQGETDESDPSIHQVYTLIGRSKSTFTVSTK